MDDYKPKRRRTFLEVGSRGFAIPWYLGVKYESINMTGIENITEEPCIIASNHTSGDDPLALIIGLKQAGVQRHVRYAARQDIKKVNPHKPVHKRILQHTGNGLYNYFLNRVGAVILPHNPEEAMEKLLREGPQVFKEGYHLGIFPEARRVQREGLAKFHQGAARLAIQEEKDVVPVFIEDLYRLPRQIGKGTVNINIGKKVSPNGKNPRDLTMAMKEAVHNLSNYQQTETTYKRKREAS